MYTIDLEGDLSRQAIVQRANDVSDVLMAQAPMDEARGTLTRKPWPRSKRPDHSV